jgi:uncharacterized membrane protein
MTEVANYVERVRAALADLPPSVRDELLEELPEHLAEVAAEGGGSLADRLGPPEVYAAELRAAAGVATAKSNLDDRARDAVRKARARLRLLDAKSGPAIGYAKASDFLRLLIPAWWVLRGYLVAMGFAYLVSESEIGLLPRVDVGDRTLAGVVVLVGFVIASIWLGRRSARLTRWPRWILAAGTALLVLPALASLADTDGLRQQQTTYQTVYSPPNEIQDIFVYDDQGRPLTNVRLYDQNGQPIQLGYPGWWCESEFSGEYVYPLCPDRHPFRGPGTIGQRPQPSLSPSPSTSPEAGPSTPVPTPSATG